MYDICTAIIELTKDSETGSARVGVNAEDHSQITWYDSNPNNITVDQIKAKQAELKAEYDAKEYQRLRQPEYPTIDELVVALYDADDKADIDKRRADVKAKYPKPE